ncbi:MAG: oligosaccharyl transferase glycoprotein complex, beta subunit [Piccolia ochrophora]|nr:MAG: oligosaccharyl transferase glycoprotein complex, beta subunit [Piccolia ochrophora]
MWWSFSLVLLALLRLVLAVSTTGNRLLVVLEEAGDKSKYSNFWADLGDRGFKITFESPKNEKLSLFEHAERAYDHLILLPPKSKGLGPSLTPALLLKFLNQGGNVLLTLSGTAPTPSALSSFLLELDIHLPPDRTSLVTDHFGYDTISSPQTHDVLLLQRPEPLRSDARNPFAGPSTDIIAFPHGTPHTLGQESPLLAPILRAPSTAYTYSPKDDVATVEDPFATGAQLSLVSALQARNSARFTVLGAVEALEDAWSVAKVQSSTPGSKAQKTANRAFAAELSAWTFMETGVLRVDGVSHRLADSDPSAQSTGSNTSISSPSTDLNPKIYRVKNDVTFTVHLSEHALTHWIPYTLPATDALQLEVRMLSPFHRVPLLPSKAPSSSAPPNSTAFSTTLTLPDQHGIFHFLVNYKRPFLAPVSVKRTVTVRHFAHDEWPRSWRISGGWVWVAGVWVVVAAWVLFVAGWLWCEPPRRREKGGKKVQ